MNSKPDATTTVHDNQDSAPQKPGVPGNVHRGPQNNPGVNVGIVGHQAREEDIIVIPRQTPEYEQDDQNSEYIVNQFGDTMQGQKIAQSRFPIPNAVKPPAGPPPPPAPPKGPSPTIIDKAPEAGTQLGGAKTSTDDTEKAK